MSFSMSRDEFAAYLDSVRITGEVATARENTWTIFRVSWTVMSTLSLVCSGPANGITIRCLR